MLTAGFKLFFGFGLLAAVGAVVYGVATGDPSGADYIGVVDRDAWKGVISLGWQGGVGEHTGFIVLVFAALVSGGLGCMLVAFRDADAESVGELDPGGEAPPTVGPSAPSYWPALSAFAVAVAVIGLVTHAAIFVIGLILAAVVAFEWMISAWADRATGDAGANRALRNRLMHPIEVPVLGAAGVAILVVGGSRVLLAVSEFSAVWIAAGVATVILLVSMLFVARPKIGKSVIAAVLAFAAVAIVAAGIVATAVGTYDHGHGEGHGADDAAETHEGEE
ncbi:MAG: hypothetical protein OXG47_08145 [bacterium]|nr:hypothetical protein [bacterium]MCY3926303.1 hypothetical protein [bacterium]